MLTTDQTAPGLAQTEAEVRSGLSSSQARVDAQQAQAERFIAEHGAAVVGGHADVRAAER